MSIVGDYIRGDKKSALMFGEVRSILYIVGLVGSMDHVTGLGADLRFISTLRSPLAVLPLLRLFNPWGDVEESEEKSQITFAAKMLKVGGNVRSVAKLTGWILKELQVASPLVAICSQISTNLWYGTTFGKLVSKKPSWSLTSSRQFLTLAMIPISWTAFGKANPDFITAGFLCAALIGLRETQLELSKPETPKKDS